ncbi:MAG: outer membrane protein assembly factor BamE [Phycisphaerae bacterium]|nr:outer membrane protein assembly factor BamE [Phycisphaerae bacterium]
MVPILGFAAIFVAALASTGCATQAAENFYALREGMTKAEVAQLLGKPSSKWPGDEGTERWQYGDNLSSLATSGLFHDADTAHVWAVWFDSEGAVDYFTAPDWVSDRQ